MLIRLFDDNTDRRAWSGDRTYFHSIKRVNGKVKATFTDIARHRILVSNSIVQYHIENWQVNNIIFYYDEAKVIDALTILFYESGRRSHITNDQLEITEFIIHADELIGEDMMGPVYARHPIISRIYQNHYYYTLGTWVKNTVAIKNAISTIVQDYKLPDLRYLGELQDKLTKMGNMPENKFKLPKNVSFKKIEEWVDSIYLSSVDMRGEK